MKDYLIKGMGFNNSVRMFACSTKDTLNYISKKMGYYPSALDALGRVLNMGVMMGSMLSPDQTIMIKVDGDGPIGEIRVDADAYGNVRACSENPRVHFENAKEHTLNVKQTIGTNGFIEVTKDLGLKEPFRGTVPIVSGEMAQDFAYYFSISEQIPTAVSVGVIVNPNNLCEVAGGFIVQLMPNTNEEVITALEQTLKKLPPLSELLKEGYTLEQIMKLITPDFTKTDFTEVRFSCNCSKERFGRGISLLSKEQLEIMINEDNGAEAVCPFCGNKYNFTKDELIKFLKNKK